jgi:UDP:flavonoid glycosyltransferase YjiC (YdhE family)
MEMLRFFGPLWGRLSLEFARGVTRAWVAEVGKLAVEQNIEPAGHPIFEGNFSPHGTLALFSPLFGPPQPDWPPNCTATGFCFYDSTGYDGQSQADWRDWIETGSPPLVVTLGSSAVFGADAFFSRSRELALNLRQRALLLKGLGAHGQSENGQIVETEYAPYSELFPRAGILIHQGGIGTTAQALRAGVPQLVVPFAHDQPDNAARVRRLGLGLSLSRRAFECGPLPEKYLRRMVENPEFFRNTTERFAVQLSNEDGPNSACAHLERIGDGSL